MSILNPNKINMIGLQVNKKLQKKKLTRYFNLNCKSQKAEDINDSLFFIIKKKEVINLCQYFYQDIP